MKRFLQALKFWTKKRSDESTGQGRSVSLAFLTDADTIITSHEITSLHGTGALLQSFFSEIPNVLSIHTQRLFDSRESFGAAEIQLHLDPSITREQLTEQVRGALNGATVGRILCVPYSPEELQIALVLKQLFKVPLCIYIMDDNNLFSKGIPDDLMAEGLAAAELRLAISPELRDAYEAKYGVGFYMLPPLVRKTLMLTSPILRQSDYFQEKTGVLLGNIWSQQWFLQLRRTIREAGVKIHWFGNTRAPWLTYNPAELDVDGIINRGYVPEEQLIEELRSFPYAIIPSGTLDEHDDRPQIARLSQPSRIPYMMAVANMPMIVMGSPETAAARFVRRFQSGKVSPYEPQAFRKHLDSICREDEQWFFRRNAAEKGALFTLDNPAQWIWDSLARGAAMDDRFEKLLPRKTSEGL